MRHRLVGQDRQLDLGEHLLDVELAMRVGNQIAEADARFGIGIVILVILLAPILDAERDVHIAALQVKGSARDGRVEHILPHLGIISEFSPVAGDEAAERRSGIGHQEFAGFGGDRVEAEDIDRHASRRPPDRIRADNLSARQPDRIERGAIIVGERISDRVLSLVWLCS